MLLNCFVGENSWESIGLQGDPTSQSWRKSVLNIHWKEWCWSWNLILWPLDAKSWLIWKHPDAGKDWRQEKGMTEDEMVGWHHRLNGHSLSKLRELVTDRMAWCAAVHVVAKIPTRLSSWTELLHCRRILYHCSNWEARLPGLVAKVMI